MPTQIPTKSQWKALFETAGRFIAEESWKYVDSRFLFGVRPASGRTCYCGFFGYYGAACGFSVYLKPPAHFRLQEGAPEEEILYSLDGIVMFLGPKSELDRKDQELLAESGFKTEVRGKWPQFRSLRRGFHPWYLEREEAVLLAACLGQGIDLSRRSRLERISSRPTGRAGSWCGSRKKKTGPSSGRRRAKISSPPGPPGSPRPHPFSTN